jgi:hypothetical protein
MKNIINALIKFQSIVPKIQFDKTNPHFKSKYSSLSGIIETINDSLSKCELTFTQTFEVRDDKTILITTLFHSSGESLKSEMKMIEINDPQKTGSVVTYFKRYSLMAILGLSSVDDDDDANAVSVKQAKPDADKMYPMKTGRASPAQQRYIANVMKETNNVFCDVEKLTFDEADKIIKGFKHGK